MMMMMITKMMMMMKQIQEYKSNKGVSRIFHRGQERRAEGRERGGILGEGQQPPHIQLYALCSLSLTGQ